MAKQSLLTAAFARNTKEAKLHADGGGLFLQVTKTGAKSWLFRFRWQGKRPEIGLGGLSDVSLAQAREKAAECRKAIRQGINPRTVLLVAEDEPKASKAPTFEECATPLIKAKLPEWSNPKHAAQWTSTLRTYAYPIVGNMPVDLIGLDEIEAILTPIWLTKNETATRVRSRVETVLAWGTVKKHRQGDNPARWKNNLDILLPKPSKVQKVKHFAALPYKDQPAFMVELRKRKSITARMLELCILTTTRTGELIAAQWEEFDLEAKVWTIPDSRTKTKKEHRIPLVPAVVGLLDSIPVVDNSPYLFPALRGKGHLSNMTMLQLVKRDMDRPDLTVHGFRSTFKDWSVEETEFPGELSEAQLSHVIKNAAQAAYERGDKLERRRELLQVWSDYCG
jgi:integrase